MQGGFCMIDGWAGPSSVAPNRRHRVTRDRPAKRPSRLAHTKPRGQRGMTRVA